MSHAPRENYKHSDSMISLNNLVLMILLHLNGVNKLTDADIPEIERIADEIRKDLEGCKDFGLKY